MKIKKGDLINELSLPSINGSVFDLENIKGKKALISFYRYSSCPFCHLRINETINNKDNFGENFETIAIFTERVGALEKSIKTVETNTQNQETIKETLAELKTATEKASNDVANADKRYNQGIKLGIQDTERLIKDFAKTTLEDLKAQSETAQIELSEQISTIESFFAPKPDPENGDQEEINKDDALVTFKEFQVLDNKVDELILLQKEIAANLLEMNRVRQVAAKKKKVTPKVAPKPKPNPLKFP